MINKTVLVADDSATIRKIVELTFMGSDVRVEVVGSGADAEDRLASLEPDLVLADVVMPEPDGYELCRRIKGSARPVPVLLLTGAFEPCDEERARICGADDHLDKPFEPEALREKVLELLSREAVAAPQAPAVVEPAAESAESEADSSIAIPTRIDLPQEPEPAAPCSGVPTRLSAEDVERVARAVVQQMSDEIVRDIARELVPQLATTLIRERIRELENEDRAED